MGQADELRVEMGDRRGAACDVPARGEERRHAAARVSSACGGVRGKGKDYGLDAWCPGVDCLSGWWLVAGAGGVPCICLAA